MLKNLLKKWTTPQVSVSGSMRDMDSLQELYKAVVEAYASTVDSIADHAPESPRQAREEYRRRLKQIRTALRTAPNETTVRATHRQLEGELKEYGRQLDSHFQAHERDTNQIMAIVASMADSIAKGDQQNNVRLKGIAKKLRLLTTCENLSDIRAHLADEAGQLERYADDMARDTQSALGRLKSELPARQEGPKKQPWVDNTVDLLTQLTGRPGAISIFESRKGTFCIARFTVENFAGLMQRHGHSVMDSLLQEYAQRMRNHLQGALLLCRWDESEFLAAVECALPDLAIRAYEMERRLSGLYSLTNKSGGIEERIAISCISSVVQPLHGEQPDQIIGRLRVHAASVSPSH